MSISDDVVQVSVETTDHAEPVLRKQATGPASGRRLGREVTLLDAARHPGVVAIVGRSGAGPTLSVDLGWAGPRSLAGRPNLPIDEIAGLATSLATTVADLHELGIVHGRIGAEHVLIGVDGRPILCGLAEAHMAGVPGGVDAHPFDDVAAIGSLVGWLIGEESEVEPIPEHRWWRSRRWDGYQRRAVLNLVDHASDPDPDRRPSARSLADAVTTAVPSARLPADRSPLIPIATPPALSGFPAAGPQGGAADVATAVGGAEADPTEGGRHLGSTRPGAFGEDRPPAGKRRAAAAPERSPRARGSARVPGTVRARPLNEIDRSFRESASESEGEVTTPPGRGSATARPTAGPPSGRGEVGAGPGRVAAGAAVAVPTESLLPPASGTASHELGRRATGTAPHRDATPVPPRSRRRWALGGLAAGLLLVSVVTVGSLTDRSEGQGARPRPTRSAASTEPPAAVRDDGTPCATVVGPKVDADGDGCAELLIVDGRRVSVGDRTFVVGEDGDRVTVGDWDCDGIATAAVLRSGTGGIYTFDRWPADGALPEATLAASVADATDVRARPGAAPGCTVLVVERGDRPARVLDLGAAR